MAMTREVREKWTEAWQQAREAKDRRRAENRAKWATSRKDWSSDHEHKLEAPIDAEPLDDTASSSLKKLRVIMSNTTKPLYQRLIAAEAILGYELAPGAAAGLDDAELIAGTSYRFLRVVADDPQTPEGLALKALKLLSAVENARAAVRDSASSLYEKKLLLVALANAERRQHLRSTGRWPPPDDMRWLDGSDAISLPNSWVQMQWPPPAISGRYEQGDATAFRAQLRTIGNDDFWAKYG